MFPVSTRTTIFKSLYNDKSRLEHTSLVFNYYQSTTVMVRLFVRLYSSLWFPRFLNLLQILIEPAWEIVYERLSYFIFLSQPTIKKTLGRCSSAFERNLSLTEQILIQPRSKVWIKKIPLNKHCKNPTWTCRHPKCHTEQLGTIQQFYKSGEGWKEWE